MTHKKWGYLILGVIALGIVAWILSNSKNQASPQTKVSETRPSYELNGNLLEIKDGSIVVEGRYAYAEKEFSPELHKVEVLVDPKTTIIRTTLLLPTAEELEKTGGRYNTSDLKQEKSSVNFTTLAEDAGRDAIGLTIKTDENIAGKIKIKAKEIHYRAPIRR